MLLASKTEKIYLDKNPFVKYFYHNIDHISTRG